MDRCKKVNVVFMMSTLMQYIVLILLELFGITKMNALQEIIMSQLVFALPAIIYLIVSKVSIGEALRIKKIRLSNVILLVVFTYLVMPVITLVNAISLIFSENEISGTITDITSQFPLYIGILAVGLLPAILEESVYRGVLYNEYRKKNPRAGILLSALLFGLLHQNLNQFAYAFVMGLIFCLVIEATDSILSTMIIHFVINSNSVILQYVLPRAIDVLNQLTADNLSMLEEVIQESEASLTKAELILQVQSLLVPAIISGVLAFVVYRTIAKNADRYDVVKYIVKNQEGSAKLFNLFSIPLIIGIAICTFNIIMNLIL